ncbi:MAG: hypothetical protein WC517_04265 [Patescibacteria group bacterium]
MSESTASQGGNQMPIIIAAIIAIIIVGAGSFYGGTIYAGSKRSAGAFGQGNLAGRAPGAGIGSPGAQGAGFVNGDVISLDDKSVTVKDKNGSSKIVFFSDSTEIGKFVAGSLSDLTVGETLMVTGKTNSDGSVTAQSIQIRPATAQMPQAVGGNAPASSN